MFGKKSIRLPDTKAMAAALADLRAVQQKHDARILWLAFLDRSAQVARQLKALGLETDAGIDEMFATALKQAKIVMKAPKTFDPDAKSAGVLQ